MIVRLVQPGDKNNWDAYVRNHPEASAYHLWAWKDSIIEAYNHKGYYLVAEKDSQIYGVLPLIHMKLPLLQDQLVALPFCDVGGPLVNSPDIVPLLLSKAVSLKCSLGARKLEIRSRSLQQTFITNSATVETDQRTQSSEKVSMCLKLPSSSEDFWGGFKSKLRSQICKAESNGLTFKWGQLQDITSFYSVFSKNMHELGSPVHSKTWFESIIKNYGEEARIGLVFLNDQPVGCGIILICGKSVSIPWASTIRCFNKLGPNMLLYWSFLKFAASNKFEIFDFGRSTLGTGTYKFKAQWGAQSVPLHWYTIQANFNGQHVVTYCNSSSSSDCKRQFLSSMWVKLPYCLTVFVGSYVRRYISL